jgi:hypothetical protein
MDKHNERSPRNGEQGGNGAEEQPSESLSLWQVISSTLAAAFGVQSSRNRQRDFSRGKASHFIVAGIAFTVLLVLGLILIVNLVV